jgi:hypothetical protein
VRPASNGGPHDVPALGQARSASVRNGDPPARSRRHGALQVTLVIVRIMWQSWQTIRSTDADEMLDEHDY